MRERPGTVLAEPAPNLMRREFSVSEAASQRLFKAPSYGIWRKMDKVSTLSGDRIVLRRPVAADVTARLMLGRHKAIVEAYGGAFDPATPYTTAHAEAAIRFLEKQTYAWVIDAGGYIGHIRLHNVVMEDRRAALAVGIDDPGYIGKGYGTEAVRLALSYAFSSGFHRISLRVLASNARAIACYRKCGFVEEGRERETAFVRGTWNDDIIMGILETEFSN